MGVYEEFLERKNAGEILDINKITRHQLKAMWYDEVKFDRDIAKLFVVTESRVKTLRKRMGVMLYDIQHEERVKLITTLNHASRGIAATTEVLSDRDMDEFEKFVEDFSERLKRDKKKEQ